MKVLVLGAGKMVEAILIGLKETEDLSSWSIFSPSGESAKALALKVGAEWVKELPNLKYDYVLLGCKPQQLPDAALLLNDNLRDSLLISVLAAISEEKQREILKSKQLVRVMPNLPVKYKVGVTLLSSNSATNELPKVQKLFSNLGSAVILQEKELEELTLLTGSGPALFYEFSKNLSESFTSLDQKQRESLGRQVFLGSAISAKNEEKSLQEMIDSVTSRGGVTIAVLENFRSMKLLDLIKGGIAAGLKRTQELKAILLRS